MRNRILSLALCVSFIFGTISGFTIPVNVFAENDIEEVTYVAESEPVVHTETFPSSLLNPADFEDSEEDKHIVNTRENRSDERASLINSNKTLWEEIMSTQFGEDFLTPFRQNATEEIVDNTNRLKIVQTDLSLPGKNGLDLNIRRKYDSQYFPSYFVSNKITDYTTLPYYPSLRTVYRFNTSTGSSIDIAFHSKDEFYKYMYDGCYIKNFSFTSDFESTSASGKGVVFQKILDKKADTGYKLTYDSSVEPWQVNLKEQSLYELVDVNLSISYATIGAGWLFDLPWTYALCDYVGNSNNGTVRKKWRDFSGVFTDIDGNLHSYSATYQLNEYLSSSRVEYVGVVRADFSDPIDYVRYYLEQTLDDGTVYNMTAYDKKSGLTYYFYVNSNLLDKRQRAHVVQVRNDYNDKIQYNYTNTTDCVPSTIIDTYGREINMSNTGISYITVPGGEQQNIKYELSILPPETLDNGSDLRGKNVYRLVVTNEAGEQTIYDARQTHAMSGYSVPDSFDVERPAYLPTCPLDHATGYNLERITYPTGLEKHYEYVDVYASYNQGKVMRQLYAVESTYEKDGEKIINKNDYTLSGAPTRTIFMNRDSDNRVVTRVFNARGIKTSENLSIAGVDVWKQVYKYDEYGNITYIGTHTDGVADIYKYSYTRRGLPYVVEHGNEKAVYSYYQNSDIPLSVTYYKNGNGVEEYSVKNTFVDGHYKIASSTALKNGAEISKTAYAYDDEGNLTSEKRWLADTDANNILDDTDSYTELNRSTSVGDDLLVSVTDIVNGVLDADGTNAEDICVNYKYNIYGSPVERIDGYGNITSVYCDALNRPVRYVYPNSTEKLVDYSAEDKRIIVTDQDGIQYKYTYNTLGYESGKYVLYNGTWKPLYTKQYDTIAGRLSELIQYTAEDTGTITAYTYDAADRLLTETVQSLKSGEEPETLQTTTYSYSGGGSYRQEKAVTVRDGLTTTVTNRYNALGELVSQTVSDGSKTYTTSYTYDYQGRPLTTTDAKGGITTNVYDVLGKLVSVTDPIGNSVFYGYDLAGRQTSVTDAMGNTSYMYYDSLDRLIKRETPFDANFFTTAKTYYDKNSRVVKESLKSNKPGEAESYTTSEYIYDSMDNLTGTLMQNESENSVVLYSYTPSGKISEMITGLTSYTQNQKDGAKTAYSYNALGQLESVTDPMGQSESYTYDYLGNPLTVIDRNGTLTKNTYGIFGIENSQAQNEGRNQSVKNTYDSAGNLTAISSYADGNLQSTIQYTYDSFNRITSEYDGDYLKSYTYDELSNLASYHLSQNGEIKDSLTYTYDPLNRLTEINNGDIITAYTYDKNGNILSKTSDSFSTEYTYNAANIITSLTNKYSGNTISGYSCEYSLDGNKISELFSDGTARNYTYDGLGRLTREIQSSAGAQNVYSYTYDRFGNRSTQNFNGDITTYEYDLNNRLIAELSDNGGTYYNYDKNGNQILARGFTLTDGQESKVEGITGYSDYKVSEYDLFNRLVNVNNGGAESYSYTYHADGLRKSKTISGATTTYSWNNGNMVAETDTNGTSIYEYDLHGVSRQIKDGTSNYYLKNAHGDVTGLYNSRGEEINTYSYDAFGNQLTNCETDTNPFRYAGEYFDTETNNIYLRNRYYDTVTGRFITEDPIKDGLNWYAYCGNNPVGFTDSYGLDKDLDDYINTFYSGKMTVTIAIQRPVANSNAVATIKDGQLINGHTFLRLDNGKGYVNYIGFAARDKGLKEMLFSQNMPSRFVDDCMTEWNVAKVYEITPDSFELISNYINDIMLEKKEYNIETYNCTTLAVEALQRGGLDEEYLPIYQHNWSLPDNVKKLMENYSAKPKYIPAFVGAAAVKIFMKDNYGYTPSNAAQDLKNAAGNVLLQYDDIFDVITN